MRTITNLLIFVALAGTLATGCQSPVDEKKSSNADLKALTVDSGTLSPAFSPNVTDYTAAVPSRVTKVTISGTKADPNATLTDPVTLTSLVAETPRTAKLTVTAPSGATKSYTVTVTRAPVPTVAPAAPTGLAVGTITANTVKLSWSPTATAITYSIYRSPSAGGPFTLLQSGITEPAFTDTEGLSQNSTYSYQVSATNEVGEGGKGATVTAMTKPLSGALLGTPVGLTTLAEIDSVVLTWTVLDGASAYRVYRATSAAGPFQALTAESATTKFTDTGLSPATTYYYKVAGFNANGQGTSTAAVSVKTKTPSLPVAPSGVVVGPATTTSLSLSWGAVAQAAGYRVYRAATVNGTYTKLGTDTPDTGYTDTGLTGSTTYYYQVRAFNIAGEGPGSSSVAGTTAAPLAAPSPLTVAATTANTVQLSWTAAAGAKSYKIYRSTTLDGTFALISSLEFVSPFTDTDLSPETTYFYQISSVDGTFETPKGTAVEARTKATPAAFIGLPEGLKATGTSNQIQLQWTSLEGAKGYRLYRASRTSAAYVRIGPDLTSTTYTDSGLPVGTAYSYRLAAFDDKGQGNKTAPCSISTTATTLPAAPTLVRTANSGNGLTVDWALVDGAVSYRIYQASGSAGPFEEIRSGFLGTSILVSNLLPLTTYYFQVLAVNALGEGPRSTVVAGTTTAAAPATPTGLAITAATSTSLALSWNASTGAIGYRLYRSTSSSGTFGRVADVQTGLSYTDTTVAAATTYYYLITSYNADAESQTSAAVSGTTSASASAIPASPVGRSVSSTTPTSLTVSWDGVQGATSYGLYRSTSSTGTYSKVGGTITTTSYTDTALASSTTYYYKITALNAAGESAQSTAISGKTDAQATTPSVPTGLAVGTPSSTALPLSWTNVANATGYRVYRSATSGGTFAKVGGDQCTTSYTDTGLTADTTYYYKVSAFNGTGESTQSSAINGKTTALVTAPAVPTGLTVGTPATTSLPLSWTSVTNATGYRLYRSMTSGGTFTQVGGDQSTTSYTDTGLTADTTYYYKVSAFSSAGEGSQSTSVAGKTAAAATAVKQRMYRTTSYDAAGKISSDVQQTFVSGTGQVATQTSYDATGALSGKVTYTYVAGTDKVSRMDTTVYYPGQTYTSSGVYTYTTSTLPNTTAYTITSTTGSNSSKVEYVIGAQGQVVEMVAYDASGTKTSQIKTTSLSATELVQKSYSYPNGVETLASTSTTTYSGTKILKIVSSSTAASGGYTSQSQSTTTYSYTGDLNTEVKIEGYATVSPPLAGYPQSTTTFIRFTYDSNGYTTVQKSFDASGAVTGYTNMFWEAY